MLLESTYKQIIFYFSQKNEKIFIFYKDIETKHLGLWLDGEVSRQYRKGGLGEIWKNMRMPQKNS